MVHIPDGNTPYSEWSAQAKKDWDKKCDEAYWRAWDRAYKEGTIETLRNNKEVGVRTAKILGVTKDEMISCLVNGEMKIVSIIESSVAATIPTKIIWGDDSVPQAQSDDYQQYLKEVLTLMKQYQHRVI